MSQIMMEPDEYNRMMEEERRQEEERRRRMQQQGGGQNPMGARGDINAAGRQGFNPYGGGFSATQGGEPNQWANRQAPQAVQPYEQQQPVSYGQERQAPQRGPQPTFNEMQKQGKPRPAPPAAQPAQQPAPQQQGGQQYPPGVDPRAAAADPAGYQRWLQGYQAYQSRQPQVEQEVFVPAGKRQVEYSQSQSPGDGVTMLGPDSMITTTAQPGQINPWTGQMTPPRPPSPPAGQQPSGGQQPPGGQQPANNFDIGAWLQGQLGGMGPASQAPNWGPSRAAPYAAGLMGMNTGPTGMPTAAYNPGQFDGSGYMTGMQNAVNTAAGNLAPDMYGAGVQTASGPGMYGSETGAPSAGLTGNVQGLYGRQVGQGNLPTYTAQALTAGGLDVAGELANLYRTGSRGVSNEVSQAISQSIANPSAFDSQRVRDIYGQLGQNIDDEFAQRETALREEMAGRGLSDSSIQGGRLADLNVGRRSARQGLANELGQLAARDFASARSAAIGQGMQRDAANLGATTGMLGQLLGTQQAGANLGLQNFNAQLSLDEAARARQAQSYGQDASALGMQNQMNQQSFDRARGRFADDLSGQQFRSNLDQQRFDMDRARYGDQLAGAQFQQGVRQQNVQNQMGLGNQALDFFNANAGFGQQNFQNQLGLAQANDQMTGNRFGRQISGLNYLSGLDQQDYQNRMNDARFNMEAGNQRYSQGLGYLDRLMGYGQSAFNNDMAQAEFNRLMQSDQDRLMMSMLGLGG